MEREEIIILDMGIDTEDIAAIAGCCTGSQASVR